MGPREVSGGGCSIKREEREEKTDLEMGKENCTPKSFNDRMVLLSRNCPKMQEKLTFFFFFF